MIWRKSSFSSSNGDCVELASDGALVYVRDSKDPDGGTLVLTPEAWGELLGAARSGELDYLL